MSSYMTDVGNSINRTSNYPELEHSTSRKRDPSSLDLTDFLNLMVVQLQNQSIDNTTDTSDMLNQMVQMQMITALTNMTDASIMSYANSLVGKEVTIGVWNNGKLEEKVVTITGTGLMDGEHVLFVGNDVYALSDIMAVGRLPEKVEEPDKPDEGGDKPVEGPDEPAEGGDKPVEGPDEPAEGGDKPVEGPDEPADGGDKPVEGPDEPAEGGDKPVEGPDEPAEGGDKPVEGPDEPAEGGDKPVKGPDEPAEGGDKPEEQEGVDPVIGTQQA